MSVKESHQDEGTGSEYHDHRRYRKRKEFYNKCYV